MNEQQFNFNIKNYAKLNDLRGKIIVIKYGGSIMDNANAQDAFAEDLVLLGSLGIKVILVHGGGPEISKWLHKAGIQSSFIKGLRVTDKETIEIVEMVLSGSVNKRLSGCLSRKGLKTVGLNGKDSSLILATKMYLEDNGKKTDIGFVGEIQSINTQLLADLINSGIIPIISPIGTDAEGNSYNINADSAAAFISGSLKAEKLLIMTDIDGVYLDIKDPSTLLPSLTVDEINQYTSSGIITGGMLPKLQCCIDALKSGTGSVHMLDGRIEHSLLKELIAAGGTKILLEREKKLCQENM